MSDKVPEQVLAINQDPTAARDDISSASVQWVNRGPTRVSKTELKLRAVNQAEVPRPDPTVLNIMPFSDGRVSSAPIDAFNPGVRVSKRVWLAGDEHQINVRISSRGSPRVRSN